MGGFLRADGRLFTLPQDRDSFTLAEADRMMPGGEATLVPLKGPVTLPSSIKSVIQRTNGSFMASHDRWVVEARIQVTHRSRYEHRIVSKALDLGYTHDGINIKRSVAFEYLNRRRQLLEEAHRDDPDRPNFESSHLYMGEDDDAAGVHLDSALRAHVAQELSREAAIEKERRKAREAKDARGKDKVDKGDKNKGSYKPKGEAP
jgi:hypothetical protein